jgi:hypothetical protein
MKNLLPRNGILYLFVFVIALFSCSPGEDGINGVDGINGTNGINGINGVNGSDIITNTVTIESGSDCVNGGNKIELGVDINGNDILDSNEITKSVTICNGVDSSEIVVSVEEIVSGAECGNGGNKISFGLDINRNTVLDLEEITSSVLVCNGVVQPSNTHAYSGIVLSSQEDVNSIATSGIRFVHASLEIYNQPGAFENYITDLSPLDNLEYIDILEISIYYPGDYTNVKLKDINFKGLKKANYIWIDGANTTLNLGFDNLESVGELAINTSGGEIGNLGFSNVIELGSLYVIIDKIQQLDLTTVFGKITEIESLNLGSETEVFNLKGMLTNLETVENLNIASHNYFNYFSNNNTLIPDISNFSFNGLGNLKSIEYLYLGYTSISSMGQLGFLNNLNVDNNLSKLVLSENPYLTDYCLIADHINLNTEYHISESFSYVNWMSEALKNLLYTPTLEQILDSNTCKK